MANCVIERFLCCYPLKTGAFFTGILMLVLMCISAIAMVAELLTMKTGSTEDVYSGPWLNAFAVTVVACIDSSAMVAVTAWFLCGVKKEKHLVVLCWLVVSALWLLQSVLLILVLLIMFTSVAKFITWLICLIITLLAFAIVAYGYLCVFAYYLELQGKKTDTPPVVSR